MVSKPSLLQAGLHTITLTVAKEKGADVALHTTEVLLTVKTESVPTVTIVSDGLVRHARA